MGNWAPDRATWGGLILAPDPSDDLSRPYPFYLAYQLDVPPEDLGDPALWAAERKWDGIRGQLILRGGEHHLWSRGEELMTDRFPELAAALDFLPGGTVIDGEVLAFAGDAPLTFNALQKRIGRKTVPKKLLAEAPVVLMAYDLLEHEGQDIRAARPTPSVARPSSRSSCHSRRRPRSVFPLSSPSLPGTTWPPSATAPARSAPRGSC